MKLRGDVIALGEAAAGDLLWRVGGRLHLTVVVKATFAMVAEGRMTARPAPPVHGEDVMLASGEGVVAPSDAAPYLGKTDVLLCGGVRGSTPARLALLREREVLLDRVAPVASLGAIASGWASRRTRLSAGAFEALAAEVPDLPVDMDWGYFQAAPQAQQVAFLTGDEWVVVRDATPRQKLRSQLPGAFAAVWVWPRGGRFDAGYPVRMFADRLLVDADTEACTITWRGAIPLETPEVLTMLTVAAGVNHPDKPVDWEAAKRLGGREISAALHVTGDGALSLMAPAVSLALAQAARTAVLDDWSSPEHAEVISAPSSGAAGDDDELDGTLGFAQAIDPQAHAPFPLASPEERPALSWLPLPGAPWSQSQAGPLVRALGLPEDDDPLDGTVGIASSPTGPALPFAGTADPPPPDAGTDSDLMRGATAHLSPEQAAVLLAEALPFETASERRDEPVSPWTGGAAVPPPRPRAPTFNALIRSELGLEPPPPAPSPPRAMSVASEPPALPERLGPAAPPEPALEPMRAAAAEIDPASVPAPPEGASQGEEFLAALAWLDENKER